MDPFDVDTSASSGARLWRILVVGVATVFAALLVALTGQVLVFWPLFVVPVMAASAFFGARGAASVIAVGVVTILLSAPGGLPGADWPQLAVALLAVTAAGAVIGTLFARSRRHELTLESASIRDEETGLFKPGYLRVRLAEEVQRGIRHDVPVGLLVVRLDGLHAFRDTFGRYKTGLLLEHLADVLRITVRDTDIVGRYGTESFGVVLPFAGPDEARAVAERVRLAGCSAEFEGDVLQPAARCPVSVASASLPADALTVEALIAAVADALADTEPARDTAAAAFRLSEAQQ